MWEIVYRVLHHYLVKLFLYFGLGLVSAMFFAVLLRHPFFFQINHFITDQLHQISGPRKEIVVIGIDDKSLQEIGAWPWEYGRFTQALEKIDAYDPAVVGIDVLFLEERGSLTDFNQSISELNYPVVLGSKIVDDEIILPVVEANNIKYGYVNFYPDPDGKIRKTKVNQVVGKQCYDSFSVEIFKEYFREQSTQPVCNGGLKIYHNNYPVDSQNQLTFTYSDNTFQYISFVDLLKSHDGAKDLPIDLENKIVLIGSTAIDVRTNLNDNLTDISGQTISGVLVHANILNSFLENEFRVEIPYREYFLLLGIIAFASLAINRLLSNFILELMGLVGIFVLVNTIGLIVYEINIDWHFVQTSMIIVLMYIHALAFRYWQERTENRFVKRAFMQYLNPKLLNQLMASPHKLKLGGEEKEMTVLFADLRGFTTLSEQLAAEDLVSTLNRYLHEMSEVIFAYDGTIDKYAGDSIMAFWNAPLSDENQRQKAIQAGKGILETLNTLNLVLPESMPQLDIGIGINFGKMVVGNIGSDLRFDYTVLGDEVNLASRLENITKKYGVRMLVSEAVIKGIDLNGLGLLARLIDRVVLKGKTRPVKIFQILQDTSENRKLKKDYETAIEYYFRREFVRAKHMFKKYPQDFPSKLLLERVELVKNIDDWDGIWSWEQK